MNDPHNPAVVSPCLLRATGLQRSAGPRCAVRDVSLELRRGEVVGLLGPNGAGKSTTLRMLAGVLLPDAGRIEVLGRALDRNGRRHVGYLPEEPPLYPELTVDEQLRLAARLTGLPRRACAHHIQRAKQRCDLVGVDRRLVGRLSKGFRQRLGLAQALLADPAVLLLDEPTDGLDPAQLRQVRGLIRGLGEDHAVLLSTHMLSEAEAVCDRVLILVDGRIVHATDLGQTDARPCYRMRLTRDPGPGALEAISGIGAVERIGEATYRLRPADQDALDRLLAQAGTGRWGLRLLEPERRSLESVFMDHAFRNPEAA